MTITELAKRYGHRLRGDPWNGPQAAFLATVAVTGALMFAGLLPHNLLMPAIGTLLFVLAAIFALVAWVRCSTDEYQVTYWDVAGALALIGICAAALVEPDQLVQLVAGAHSEN
jgi:hypothetical protein